MNCPHQQAGQCDLVRIIAARNWRVTPAACTACHAQWRGGPPTAAAPTKVVTDQCAAALRRQPVAPEDPFQWQGERVGDRLKRLIAARMDCTQCPACDLTLEHMNVLGPAGCLAKLPELVAGMLPRAIQCALKEASWRQLFQAATYAWTAGGIAAAIEALVLQAIEETQREGPGRPFPEAITVLVTAFRRPRHLERCVRSLRHWYPAARVVIADNGDQPAAVPEDERTTYLRLPFDIGLSAARNAGVAAIDTEFVLLMEDDCIIDERLNLAALLDVLRSVPEAGVVAGADEQHYRGAWREFRAADNGLMQTAPRATEFEATPAGTRYDLRQYLTNAGLLCRREVLTRVPWREELLLAEHEQFFQDLQAAGIAAAFTPDSQCGHDAGGRSAEYQVCRRRAYAIRDSRIAAQSTRCVLVVGTGRSGTSRVAQWLRAAGVNMGEHLLEANATHDYDMCEDAEFHQALVDVDRRAFYQLVDARNVSGPAWGLKSPQLSLQWDWASRANWPADTRVIHCRRERAAVRDSVMQHYGLTAAQFEEWWQRRWSALVELLSDAEQRGWTITEVDFDIATEREDHERGRVLAFCDVD